MLLSFTRNPEQAIQHAISADSKPLQLLLGYLNLVVDDSEPMDARLASVVASHVRDLIACVVAADADLKAVEGGKRAAQLAIIKHYLSQHCADPSLSVNRIAARFAISPRYIQRLFEGEKTTFTAYLLDQRLTNICHVLASVTDAGKAIRDIAWDNGLSDISYFNRCFKKRYGMSPRDFRTSTRLEVPLLKV